MDGASQRGRLYQIDVQGRSGWSTRYLKEVDSSENTLSVLCISFIPCKMLSFSFPFVFMVDGWLLPSFRPCLVAVQPTIRHHLLKLKKTPPLERLRSLRSF
jgi:hypothetical protein